MFAGLWLLACTTVPPGAEAPPDLHRQAAQVARECAEALGEPVDPAALVSGCGSSRRLFDEAGLPLSGGGRGLDYFLEALARHGDEVDYVVREAARAERPRLDMAVDHLRDANRALADRAARSQQPQPYWRDEDRAIAAEVQRRLLVELDGVLAGLEDAYRRHAWRQNLNPANVRRRQLQQRVAPARVRVATLGRVRALLGEQAAPAEVEASARVFVDTYASVVEQYVEGAVTRRDLRDALEAEVAAAYERWRAARGGTP